MFTTFEVRLQIFEVRLRTTAVDFGIIIINYYGNEHFLL